MKKNALIFAGLIVLLALVGTGFGMRISNQTSSFVVKNNKITAEQAKKIALKRVAGTVEDEFTFEDDDGETDTYIFIIKTKAGKIFEVQIGAENGEVLSVEEYDGDATLPDSDATDSDTNTEEVPPPAQL